VRKPLQYLAGIVATVAAGRFGAKKFADAATTEGADKKAERWARVVLLLDLRSWFRRPPPAE
jgi:hypothetical protein